VHIFKSSCEFILYNYVNNMSYYYGSFAVETSTRKNTDYRHVRATLANMQYVEMSLQPNQEIGWEKHKADQFFKVEQGSIKVMMGVPYWNPLQKRYVSRIKTWTVKTGEGAFVPNGWMHNIVNASNKSKAHLYTIYSPPQHPPGTRQKNKPKND